MKTKERPGGKALPGPTKHKMIGEPVGFKGETTPTAKRKPKRIGKEEDNDDPR